jgi:hypothetical protein
MKEKYCFKCGCPLKWNEFLAQNFHLSQVYLVKLWNHKSIQFYCCECFKDENFHNKGLNHSKNSIQLYKKKRSYKEEEINDSNIFRKRWKSE